jgi:phytoene synthase
MSDLQQIDNSREELREQLLFHSQRWVQEGFPVVAAEGKLLRPMVAYHVASGMDPALLEDERFWDAVLAIQMVHEASLAHDDIIDQADTRRGKPTMVSQKGVAGALVFGDHLLTSAYRIAAKTRCMPLLERFTEAVEQTVAGEIEQAKTVGRTISMYDYSSVVAKKSGALFAFALSIAPMLLDDSRAKQFWLCGLRFGIQYQRLDDMLDYCPQANSGKPPLQDFHQRKPTWPVVVSEQLSWDMSSEEVLSLVFACASSPGGHQDEPLARLLLSQFQGFGSVLRDDLQGYIGEGAAPLCQMLTDWDTHAERAIAREEAVLSGEMPCLGDPEQSDVPAVPSVIRSDDSRLRELLVQEGLSDPANWPAYFRHHSRSFSFAAKWFPPEPRKMIAGVYAYCRASDELADGFGELTDADRAALLGHWKRLTTDAYEGKDTGIPLLNHVIGGMSVAQVPLRYPLDLIEGMEMDLTQSRYHSIDELMRYCYCVASTVGLWLTEGFGQHEPWVLSRADSLGKAMQLTNILRDVGEDLERDRIYLPLDMLASAGITEEQLWSMKRGDALLSSSYRGVLAQLMELADKHYLLAYQGMTGLPSFFARPVAVAASVYQGIHREIRKNAFDNLRKRAHTSAFRKASLACSGLMRLWLTVRPTLADHLLEEAPQEAREQRVRV